ncbi:MarR family transcriptional regulator [Candidatus Roizmanbacteria bacterium CG_4_9_14_3_um_filter_33_18]|uniref:MarR family transcriptional regulator n=3 Tax=Candidatus Roizmaniibacteriota TaxID=1752723 RepID=A0A2M7U9A8_9BACT|nr:MAG: MarR family transcriptional regulator [Candidatus Roizmanbacteria bacterium CG22_combo_CG10-13_8_21_14_all_34_12]PIZ67824.1 MAG: MarR family transcriptional regulator [Candidatus Roizmanbacteria bacterium CG_4_10_14_0_2_um_filter_33_96]PJA55309.1 MAG: MarR family transcriptional regulator [Candidatus Roizmanbacteria bacterium CG_4_9_14_3_um_filter_33_18]
MKTNKKEEKHYNHLLKTIGDYWTLSIIMELKKGKKRFCELERAINKINPVTLTERLKRLEKVKFIDREKELSDKLSVTYSLNKNGLKLIPIINEINFFASNL